MNSVLIPTKIIIVISKIVSLLVFIKEEQKTVYLSKNNK